MSRVIDRTIDVMLHADSSTSIISSWKEAAFINLRKAAFAETRRDVHAAAFHRATASFCLRKMAEVMS